MPSHDSSIDHRAGGLDLAELAQTLGTTSTSLLVWKGARDLATAGDLDCAAPREVWPDIEKTFRAWATANGIDATITCAHAVGMRILVGCGGSIGSHLLQVDIVDEKLVHGVPVWTAAALEPFAHLEEGIRCLQPGAEGVARILAHRGDERGRALAFTDRASATALAYALGAAGRLALRRGAVARAALELTLAGRALTAPRTVLRAVRTDSARRRCRVLTALKADRTAPGDLERWLAGLAYDHQVAREA